MIPILTAIKKLFRKPDELESRLRSALKAVNDRERRNLMARAAARLESLDRQGTPFPDVESAERPGTAAARYRYEFVYETNASGYRYAPAIHRYQIPAQQTRFEQDPLFGWPAQAFPFDPFDLWTEVAVNSFPRELYPDRPTTLRTQIAQDAVRLQSRIWFETVPQYSGPIGHLVNFVCGAGLTWQVVVCENKQETVYEQEEPNEGVQPSDQENGEDQQSPDEALAEQVQEFLDGFCAYRTNDCIGRCESSALNILRDGEDALRVFPAPDSTGREETETYPVLRTVDTSTIRGPHNEITGPWSFGVLTNWPQDWETPLAFHVWYSDNTHEDVSPEEMHLTKLFTVGPNVKRGVPLAYKIRKQIPQAISLLDCIAIGEAARQSIPYVKTFEMADSTAVRAATPSWVDRTTTLQDGFGLDEHRHGHRIEPGKIPLINKGQNYNPPPEYSGNAGQTAMLVLDEKIAAALQVPLWFVKASTDEETKANALTAQSPVLLLIRRIQRKLCEHYRCIFEYAVNMAIAAGKLPVDTLKRIKIHCELPNPESRDEDKAIASDLELMDKELLSPQHVCARHNLDFDEEQDLIALAKKSGWVLTKNVPPDNMPGNEGDKPPGGSENADS